MPLTSAAAGAAMLSLVVNGLPMQASYLQSDRDGCDAAQETARLWQKDLRVKPVQTRLDGWCTVGAVIGSQWVSEQWRTPMVSGKTSGWRVVIPLGEHQRSPLQTRQTVVSALDAWHLDVVDAQIATRIRYRQSLQGLDQHHQESHRAAGGIPMPATIQVSPEHPLRLSRHRNGEVLISGRHPDGGSYSVLIERGIEK